MFRLLRLIIMCCAASATVARGVAAQKGSARIFGSVVNRATQAAIPGTLIIHAGDGRFVTSDSFGYFQFPELAAGIVRFTVRAPGFPAATFVVALTNGERMERDIELDSVGAVVAEQPTKPGEPAQALPEVTVEAASPLGRRYADFERRRATGRGQYLTRADIEMSGASTLQDAVRNLRGVRFDCSGTQCSIRMARAPMSCLPSMSSTNASTTSSDRPFPCATSRRSNCIRDHPRCPASLPVAMRGAAWS